VRIGLKKLLGRDAPMAYLFILPNFLWVAVFTIYSIFYGFYLSFHDWNLVSPNKVFVGFANYINIIKDPLFHKVLTNTVIFTIWIVPIGMLISLLLAIFLNGNIPGKNIFRSAYFFPVITPIAAVAQVWIWIYEPTYGILNWFLNKFGIQSVAWLADPKWAMPAVIIFSIWKGLGYNMVLYLAALQDVPRTLYEAAQIDGAGRFAQFRYVTLPGIQPATFFVLINSIIGSFQTFNQVYIMTRGGPLDATNVLAYYLYQNAFQFFKVGYGSAVAFILFGILFAFTILLWLRYIRTE